MTNKTEEQETVDEHVEKESRHSEEEHNEENFKKAKAEALEKLAKSKSFLLISLAETDEEDKTEMVQIEALRCTNAELAKIGMALQAIEQRLRKRLMKDMIENMSKMFK